MGRLFRYELKKILSRKILWVALMLCVVVQLLYSYGDIRLALGGAVSGMKEVYARYDGEALTDTLKAQMLSDYREYASAHPEEFKPSVMDIGYWALDEQGWQRKHGYGVMLAYQELLAGQTREETKKDWQRASDELASGIDADGNTLSRSARQWDTALTAQPPYTPVVRYNLGWSFSRDPQGLVDSMMQKTGIAMIIGYSPMGVLLLLLLLLIGLPGFPGERSARMEPVLVTCARRRPAALIKLLAVVSVIAATALALNLLQLLLRAATLGLGGWNMPAGPYGMGASYLTSWSIATLGFVLGCAAGAVIITALSALSRGSLAALGLAFTVLAAQYALLMFSQPVYFSDTGNYWAKALYDAASALPLNVIGSSGNPYGLLPHAMQIATLFALPLALCAVCLWLAPKTYLQRRKA